MKISKIIQKLFIIWVHVNTILSESKGLISSLDPESDAIFFKIPTKTMSIIVPGDVVRKHAIPRLINI